MCENTRFLGLAIDSQLRWKKHVESLSTDSASIGYTLRIIARSTTSKLDLIPIMFVAKFAVKSCVRSAFRLHSRTSCKNLFKEYKILTLPAIYYLSTRFLFMKTTNFLKTKR
ncbi:hypothetical protein Trydic_g23318 [Trypoxylus dichotomus]